jgi:EAL domain-containing protein (putative c-di-GMP-specific phosphodiesterase class I)
MDEFETCMQVATRREIDTSLGTARRARVLVVDDEPALRRGISRILRTADYEVAVAADGGDAARLLETERFDLILTDIDLPGMSGLDLLRHARARGLDSAVMLITGYPAVQTAVEALDNGAASYLIKPVEAQTLLDAVRRAIDLRAATRAVAAPQPAAAREALDANFDRALQSLWMAYQPIIRWSTRETFAHEALVRSGDPGLPGPSDLLGAADRLGRLYEIGRVIRGRVAEAARETPADTLFVNLHPCDLLDPELYDGRTPLAGVAKRIVLEITERAALDQIADVRDRVAGLRALGYRLAVDDLGAGYAGLSSFAQVEPEVVKIDMSLVRGIDTEPMKRKLVGSMVSLCADMQLLLVAEGVETVAERDTLVGLGCDFLQGYLFARPARRGGAGAATTTAR